MSDPYLTDTHYRLRAARRNRILLSLGLIFLLLACSYLGVSAVFRDNCTGSFDRAPRSVVTSFVEAITSGDRQAVIRCWDNRAYYDLEAGCSEICLSRILGTSYRVVDLTLSEPYSEHGRARIVVTVSIVCSDSGEPHTGEIVLDGIASDVPWRHWKVVRSTFGGPLAAPWCK